MRSPVQIFSWLAMKIHKPVHSSCILRFLPPQIYKPRLNSNVLQRYGIIARQNLGSDLPSGNIIRKESVSSEWVQEINRPELLLSFREMAAFLPSQEEMQTMCSAFSWLRTQVYRW